MKISVSDMIKSPAAECNIASLTFKVGLVVSFAVGDEVGLGVLL